jgi:hypothetical protein
MPIVGVGCGMGAAPAAAKAGLYSLLARSNTVVLPAPDGPAMSTRTSSRVVASCHRPEINVNMARGDRDND